MAAKRDSIPLEMADCPCAGATLDRLIQPAILVVLADGPLHGYRLAGRIGKMPMFRGAKPDGSGIYRFLKAMEGKGFVQSSWDMSRNGPARRIYEITPAGQSCLERWVKTLEDYREGLTFLLKAARKATGD